MHSGADLQMQEGKATQTSIVTRADKILPPPPPVSFVLLAVFKKQSYRR